VIVSVVWATREVQDVVCVELPAGATLADAVSAAGLIAQYALDPLTLRFAIFGARAEGGTPVAEGDRVEIVGPLIVDPKVARARRARAKSAAVKSSRGQR
jgi:putative ubiquitin-RnfH superfamily antitoxin RatB of RatAB toxin-antitoxin module